MPWCTENKTTKSANLLQLIILVFLNWKFFFKDKKKKKFPVIIKGLFSPLSFK